MKYLFFIPLIIGVSLLSCTSSKKFEIAEFKPILNFAENNDTINLPMDLSSVINTGISIPSNVQSASGYFKFSFKVVNRYDKPRSFRYKIFYHNDSYKFEESLDDEYNVLASNNFYGSWVEAKDSFHISPQIPNDGEYHVVYDSFKIVGNPRDEQKYFGPPLNDYRISRYFIDSTIESIKKETEWYNNIKAKAKEANIPLSEQLYKDAVWAINDRRKKGNVNNRWKRNPYVGCYSFALAITSDENLSNIPETIKDISKQVNNFFVDPYYTLLFKAESLNNLTVVKANSILRTKAIFSPGSGLYISESKIKDEKFDTSYFNQNCGWSDRIYNTAQFEQYFHTIDKNIQLDNIPVSESVADGNYTREAYNRNKEKYSNVALKHDCFQISNIPGKTVKSDPVNNKLVMKNPGNGSTNFRKEQVGINSRVGLTYGKFIARIKFPAIINKDNVWNGLTCAYWLKYQDESEWNNRMICEKEGYLEKSVEGPNSPKLATTYYSEIDFEILKTSNYWPQTSYAPNSKVPVDHPADNHNLMVTCTNWDLACKAPENFSVGAKDFQHNDTHYITHRWDDWYKAITIKTPVEHDSLFNRPSYYEIEWRPDRIIWRIGADRNHMMEVAYMDNTITSIPNNQMQIVFTQEFHDSKWWPLSPFLQELIPYPANDITGEILEMVVE